MLLLKHHARTFSLILVCALFGLDGCGGGGSGAQPAVTTVQPPAGRPGTAVALAGSGLGAATEVRLGAVDLPIATLSDDQITFLVPSWMPSGPWPVQVVLADGDSLNAAAGFQALAAPPVLSEFIPASGAVGQKVYLVGSNFPPTGLSVSFGGLDARIEKIESEIITTVVPPGVKSGPITVTGPAGAATSTTDFQVTVPVLLPQVDNMQPDPAVPGAIIDVYGFDLTGATAVTFAGTDAPVPASAFTVEDDEWIRATVPTGASSGYLTVATPSGAAISDYPFTVLPAATAAPVITRIDPATTFEDQYIYITGANLSPVSRATVGGQAMAFTRYSDTALEVYPPPDGALVSGPVVLTAPLGDGTSPAPFTLLPRVPEVDSLMPRNGGPGTAVVFLGRNLDQVASVQFGGTTSTDIQNRSVDRTRFTVPLPADAQTGAVTVTSLNGTVVPVAGTFSAGTGAPLAYALAKAYLTQGIQDGTVSLVAGKPAVFRAFPLANQANGARPAVRVTLSNGGASVFTQDLPGPAGGVPQDLDENAPGGYTVAVPGNLVQPGLTLLAELLPDPSSPPAPGTPTTFPSSGSPVPLQVDAYPQLDVVLVPLQFLTSSGGTPVTGQVNPSTALWQAPIQARYPLSTIQINIAPTALVTDVVVRPGEDEGVEQLQAAVEVARRATRGAEYQNWHGVFTMPAHGSSSGYSTDGTPGSPENRSSVGFDGTMSPYYDYAKTLVHEIGHNKGRDHAPCGGALGPDPAYPYPPARLGGAAYDVAGGAPVNSQDHFDMMSYCYPSWISVYTYKALQDWFLADQTARTAIPAPQFQDSLAISGRIRDGVVSLDPALEFSGIPAIPQPGPYTLRCLDSTGGTLLALPFQPKSGADDHSQTFVLLVPMTPALKAGLASLVVESLATGTARPAAARRDRAALALPREPVAVAWGPGTVHVGWDRGSHPRVLVRDDSGRVLAIAGAGEVEVATGAKELELLMSDGVRTTVRRIPVGP